MQASIVRNDAGLYRICRPVSADELLGVATGILEERFHRSDALGSPNETRNYLMLKLAGEEREVFGVVFLDCQHRVLAFEVLFQGSLSSTSVHPREVVKRCLALNAGAVILAHNHPSGVPDPSSADRAITDTLGKALELVEVRLLDHIVVGGSRTVSFAEKGWV